MIGPKQVSPSASPPGPPPPTSVIYVWPERRISSLKGGSGRLEIYIYLSCNLLLYIGKHSKTERFTA